MKRRVVLCGTAGLASLSGCLFDDDADGDIDGHESGTLEVVVDGEPIDFSADRYQDEHADNSSIDFHFHEGDDRWYMDRNRVTFADGIDLLPYFEYESADDDHVVIHDGTVYDGSDPGTDLEFRVDGDPVDPTETELHDGDELHLEITTDG